MYRLQGSQRSRAAGAIYGALGSRTPLRLAPTLMHRQHARRAFRCALSAATVAVLSGAGCSVFAASDDVGTRMG